MNNAKWTAQELLDSFNKECNQYDMNELYKALIVYCNGGTEITDLANETLDYYFENDNICSILNNDLIDYYQENEKN